MNLPKLTEQVCELSKEVAGFIQSEAQAIHTIETKSLNNLVTEVDKHAEKLFVDGLSQYLPEAGFIAEEGTATKKGERYNWVIDPLDGTTNFIHGIPGYCTSVALLDGESPVLGVVFAIAQHECFSAYKNGGARLNGELITCSNRPSLSQSLIATGFPYDDFSREEAYLLVFKQLFKQTRGIRRIGSAALDLAYTACGRFDAFFEYGLNPWDVAAGMILVTEAGGKVTDFSGKQNAIFGEEIIASSTPAYDAISSIIESAFNTN